MQMYKNNSQKKKMSKSYNKLILVSDGKLMLLSPRNQGVWENICKG